MAVSKNKKNILLLVEGRDTERKFFDRYGDALMGKSNIQIVPFCCNIYAFYSFLSSYDFNIDTEEALLHFDGLSQEEKDELRVMKFVRKYLVFDFDFQESGLSPEEKKKRLREMNEYFSDDSDQGLLFINYPMFEAVREPVRQPPICFSYESKYSEVVDKRGIRDDFSRYLHNDFLCLIKNSLVIEKHLLSSDGHDDDGYELFSQAWRDGSVLRKQLELLDGEGHFVYCLNTSVQLALAYFGKNLYRKL